MLGRRQASKLEIVTLEDNSYAHPSTEYRSIFYRFHIAALQVHVYKNDKFYP